METQGHQDLGMMMARTATRRNLLKRGGGGALAAMAAMSFPRVAGAQPGAFVDTHVLASGVSAMPAEELVWRLVADRAAPAGQGESLERALGFAMATVGPMRIVDDSAGTETYLQVGESAFVREAAFERRESLDKNSVAYVRIGLVPPQDAGYTAGGELMFASWDSFWAPGGERIIRLLGANLGYQEGTELVNTGTQTLVLVTAGRVGIMTHGGGDPIEISAGTAVAFGTGMTLSGEATGKNRFVAAQIL